MATLHSPLPSLIPLNGGPTHDGHHQASIFGTRREYFVKGKINKISSYLPPVSSAPEFPHVDYMRTYLVVYD